MLISLALLPAWSVLWGDHLMVSLYCAGLLALIVLKRLLSNRTPFPADLPRNKVLLNRLFRDRDVEVRAEWVRRMPGRPANG